MKRIFSCLMLSLILISILTLTLNTKPVKAWSGTVYIRADGSIDPPDAPIITLDKVTYILMNDITRDVIYISNGIVVERDNIIIDGNGHSIENLMASYTYFGIKIVDRNNVTIKNINIKSCSAGIKIANSKRINVYGNNITNSGNGIYLNYSSNSTIYENTLTNNLVAIELEYSANNSIIRNIASKNDHALEILHSQNNIIARNNITSNDYYGLLFSYSSNNNIFENDISNNVRGIQLHYSDNCIYRNNIALNTFCGIAISYSRNKIFHNNFIDNYKQADLAWATYTNIFDDGYPSGGNYWSDYIGIDEKSGPNQDCPGSDGIGDTPYIIDSKNKDRYPLMRPWTSKSVVLVVADPNFVDEYLIGFTRPFYERLLKKGYSVRIISHTEICTFDFAPYNAAVITWDPSYITEPKDYGNLLDSGIGFVFMSADVEKVGLGAYAGATSYGTSIYVVNNTHYITSPFSIGNLEVYSEEGYRNYMQRAAITTLLANITIGDIIVVFGNRIYFGLPWAKKLTENGWVLFDRSIEFAMLPVVSQPLLKAPWVGIARITQGNNGTISHYDYGTWDNTYAIDVALPVGSPVLAPADGIVKYVDDDPSGVGGKELAIEHAGPTGKKFVTVFLHLSTILVKVGDSVKQGQVVAKSGATGKVSGPHLHFHMWRPKGTEPEWAFDSHTMPIERLLMKQVGVDSDFKEYNARKGELDDDKVSGKFFESNNYSPEDVYWLAKAIMSEASIGTVEEQIAVGWTVINRFVCGRFGITIEDVVKSGYAYNQEPTTEIKSLARDLLERKIPDPTEGATYFFSPRSMPKEGEDTTGFDIGGGLHQVPLDGQDVKVYFSSWAKPEKGVIIAEDTTRYVTAQPIPNKLEWRNLAAVRTWFFMFYRSYTTEIQAKVKSLVELSAYDSIGRVTGLVNGSLVADIPGSDYYDGTIIIHFPNDTYRYAVAGKAEGLYGLTVTAITRQENITFSASDIPILTNAIHQYTIDWDALRLGEEGVIVQVDSDGDGVFEHTFTSDNQLTHNEFILQTETTIDFDPDTLNLGSKGRWVTAYIEFPEGYDVADINVSTTLLNGTIPVDVNAPITIGDYDNDSIPDLMIKFNRADVISYILANVNLTELYENRFMTVTLTITGKLNDGTPFQGSCAIKIILPMPRCGRFIQYT